MGVGFRVHASHSHYSYHASNGSYLLCDLQGSYSDNKFVLTDPVIHSRAGEFGATDGGEEATQALFARHRCNGFCEAHWSRAASLGLPTRLAAKSGTTFFPGER